MAEDSSSSTRDSNTLKWSTLKSPQKLFAGASSNVIREHFSGNFELGNYEKQLVNTAQKKINPSQVIRRSQDCADALINCMTRVSDDLVATAGRDYYQIHLWHYPELQIAQYIETNHQGDINALVYSSQCDALLSASEDGTVRIFKNQDSTEEHQYVLKQVIEVQGPAIALLLLQQQQVAVTSIQEQEKFLIGVQQIQDNDFLQVYGLDKEGTAIAHSQRIDLLSTQDSQPFFRDIIGSLKRVFEPSSTPVSHSAKQNKTKELFLSSHTDWITKREISQRFRQHNIRIDVNVNTSYQQNSKQQENPKSFRLTPYSLQTLSQKHFVVAGGHDIQIFDTLNFSLVHKLCAETHFGWILSCVSLDARTLATGHHRSERADSGCIKVWHLAENTSASMRINSVANPHSDRDSVIVLPLELSSNTEDSKLFASLPISLKEICVWQWNAVKKTVIAFQQIILDLKPRTLVTMLDQIIVCVDEQTHQLALLRYRGGWMFKDKRHQKYRLHYAFTDWKGTKQISQVKRVEQLEKVAEKQKWTRFQRTQEEIQNEEQQKLQVQGEEVEEKTILNKLKAPSQQKGLVRQSMQKLLEQQLQTMQQLSKPPTPKNK